MFQQEEEEEKEEQEKLIVWRQVEYSNQPAISCWRRCELPLPLPLPLPRGFLPVQYQCTSMLAAAVIE